MPHPCLNEPADRSLLEPQACDGARLRPVKGQQGGLLSEDGATVRERRCDSIKQTLYKARTAGGPVNLLLGNPGRNEAAGGDVPKSVNLSFIPVQICQLVFYISNNKGQVY